MNVTFPKVTEKVFLLLLLFLSRLQFLSFSLFPSFCHFWAAGGRVFQKFCNFELTPTLLWEMPPYCRQGSVSPPTSVFALHLWSIPETSHIVLNKHWKNPYGSAWHEKILGLDRQYKINKYRKSHVHGEKPSPSKQAFESKPHELNKKKRTFLLFRTEIPFLSLSGNNEQQKLIKK